MGINIQKYDVRLVKEEGSRYELDKKVKKPEEAHKVFVEVLELHLRPQEVFAIITIDVKSNLNGVFEVSKGNLYSSIVHPTIIFQRAILQNAVAIVMGHNHPSGDTKPSDRDIKITNQIIEAGKILDINMMDHVVIGDRDNFVSMREKEVI